MDVLGPLMHVVLRSLVVLFPLTVGWLGFRRLAHSKSSNAWIYAVICLFTAVTTASVLPWTLGMTELNWIAVAMALMSPALWICVILLCDLSRTHRYGNDPLVEAARFIASRSSSKQSPLLLNNPLEANASAPVFRHRAKPEKPKVKPREMGQAAQSILSLARDIRNNPNSDRHRPKLLPAPDGKDMPFLRRSHDL